MTQERTPDHERSLVGEGSETSPWDLARQRLADPEDSRTSWLATTRPDGRPHLMPVIAFWIDGAMHIVVGEGTRKGRNLSADDRCVVATSSSTLPSLDIVIEGSAEALTDDDVVRHMAEVLNEKGWPLEAKGDKVFGPNAPTAGTTAVHDLPDRPVEGVRSPRHVRHGTVRSVGAAATDPLGLRGH